MDTYLTSLSSTPCSEPMQITTYPNQILFHQTMAPCLQATAFFSSSYIQSPSNPDGRDHTLSSSPLPWRRNFWDTLPGTTSLALRCFHPTCLPKLGKLHQWGPPPSRSPGWGTLLMLILALPPTLSEPSSSYHWRFRIQETYTKDNRVVTHLTDAGDCPSVGCSRLLTLQFQHSFSSTWNKNYKSWLFLFYI
jgi:hypothetical protein